MEHSSLIGTSIHATCEAIIMAKTVDKNIGKPTTDLGEQQLTQVAGAVMKNQSGGLSGCVALVLIKPELWVVTAGVTTAVVTRQAKPALVYIYIDTNTSHDERMVKYRKRRSSSSKISTRRNRLTISFWITSSVVLIPNTSKRGTATTRIRKEDNQNLHCLYQSSMV